MKKSGLGLFLREQSCFPYSKTVSKINSISYEYETISQLKKIARLLRDGEIQSENEWIAAFALIKEVIFRLLGFHLFDTQTVTALSLINGHVAELPTGEGKTLAAVLTAAAWALSGRTVHVLVFNDYLAKRDCLLARPVFDFFGLSSGFIQQSVSAEERRNVYQCNIVYVSAKEAGFDYLRNFLCQHEADLFPINQDCAIVDEADSIMIDEAKIPLVLAGTAPDALLSAAAVACAVKSLSSKYVEVNSSANQAYLTDNGIGRIESNLQIQNLYAEENINLLSMVNAALQAEYLLVRDKDYLVRGNGIQIIDEFTGRIAENRRYPDLLQNAVEAKEQIHSSPASMIYHTSTLQSFLLKYKSLCGMTGTAQTSVKEFWSMYGLNVDVIPPNKACARIDHEDILFDTNDNKLRAVAQEVKRAYEKGQPVLIGTQSVMESETLSVILQSEAIPHSVLNAKNDEAEAKLIAKSGESFRVTVSTNMAGRGVDIKLGGEYEQDKQKVLAAGGLYVIGTGINRSIRIDNQLRGRAGRQGDAGESRFFISLEDPLMIQYEFNPGLWKRNGYSFPVTEKQILKAVRKVQRFAEGEDAEARYMLSRYSYIQEEQTSIITDLRNSIVLNQKQLSFFAEREPEYYRNLVKTVGIEGVSKAERQLTLYYINLHWAQYLESMESVRDGIHLMLIGGKNPIDEYHRAAISAFDEMMDDIKNDIIISMKRYQITADGIDLKSNGLNGATTTWTYLIDESSSQFSRLPHFVKTVTNQIEGTVFTVQAVFQRIFGRKEK